MDIGIRRGLANAWAMAAAQPVLLAAYAGLGVAVPYLLLSSEPLFSLRTVMAILADPWAFRFHGSVAGPLYLLAIVAAIAAGAMLAAWNGLLADLREGYISEIMYGMVAGLAYLIGNLVLNVATWAIMFLPALIFGGVMRWEELGGGAPAFGYRLVLTIVGFWVAIRLCLTGPIMGERGKLEPVSAFVESWRRTRAAQWRLCGFYLLYGLLFGIAMAALMLAHGAIILNNAPGSLAEMLTSAGWVLLFALYFLGQILIPAGLYRSAEPAAVAREIFG